MKLSAVYTDPYNEIMPLSAAKTLRGIFVFFSAETDRFQQLEIISVTSSTMSTISIAPSITRAYNDSSALSA